MDWTAIVVAAFAATGTFFGSWYGIHKSNDLIAYRMDQLEVKVDKHNHLVERMYCIEKKVDLIDDRLTHRVEDLEDRP